MQSKHVKARKASKTVTASKAQQAIESKASEAIKNSRMAYKANKASMHTCRQANKAGKQTRMQASKQASKPAKYTQQVRPAEQNNSHTTTHIQIMIGSGRPRICLSNLNGIPFHLATAPFEPNGNTYICCIFPNTTSSTLRVMKPTTFSNTLRAFISESPRTRRYCFLMFDKTCLINSTVQTMHCMCFGQLVEYAPWKNKVMYIACSVSDRSNYN